MLEALEASAAYRTTSLSLSRGNDDEAGETLGDAVGTDEEGFGLADDRATFDRLLRSIGPREREVLRLRFEEDLTQAEIGAVLGVSQMQVSRIIRQSLARLRQTAKLNEHGDAAGPRRLDHARPRGRVACPRLARPAPCRHCVARVFAYAARRRRPPSIPVTPSSLPPEGVALLADAVRRRPLRSRRASRNERTPFDRGGEGQPFGVAVLRGIRRVNIRFPAW